MSMPPERISIKRRRQDEPVETLVLEQTPSRDKKRRATDFLFRRLRADEVDDVPPLPRLPGQGSNPRHEKHRSASQNDDSSGIPQIRTTLPGEEVEDLKALKLAIKARSQASNEEKLRLHSDTGLPSPPSEETASRVSLGKLPANVRRFHLSREQNILGPSKHGGIRKSAHHSKTRVATFIEKGLADFDQRARPSSKFGPENKIAEKTSTSAMPALRKETTKHDLSDQPFVKSPPNVAKTGRTIKAHPDSWDFDSDQLASELAAFAFELDPSGSHEHGNTSVDVAPAISTSQLAAEDDYIYETYVRLPHGSDIKERIEMAGLGTEIGILVIAKEYEELWETFAELDDDDEDEWDEEDGDSNAEDNPANDYPEDEISSDDEFGLGAYKRRRNASDDEEFDIDREE